MQNLAKEQWLLNDLRDICPGSLPRNLKSVRKLELSGKFVLQITSAMDIGTPAYQQYLKLQKVNTENIEATTVYEDKVPAHRMIKLNLTDGVQDISAIEYKPMRNLTCDITPGCKILLKGPVICRKGILLLMEDKIEFLGGEVQEIVIANSLPGLLSTKLGIALTQGPTITDTGQNLNTNIQSRNSNLPTPSTQMPSCNLNEDLPKPIARVTSLQIANFTGDDVIDLDLLEQMESEYVNNSGITATKRPLKEDSHTSVLNPEKKTRMEPVLNCPEGYLEECDIFCNEDEEYLREIEAEFDNKLEAQMAQPKNRTVSSEPFVYIKQINELKDSEKVGKVFKIKAQILKLLSKLTVGKETWSLKCVLIDGTGQMDVDFTSDVLTKLIGYSPKEMKQLRHEISSKPELKEKAGIALQKAKETLQTLNCLIEITFLETPTITSLIPFNKTHANLLRKRYES
ncbi:RecQ-mediated genome instability protein 1 [Eumeta japonica]|uniref:RecQ-mediated genome instability protein 1 n=1 Tax=Eumeta variegata TaxID=151549 RepID=A0A4C1X272_EUMVA|nr:RecQ-mediated genome instability protein 1 [Eumeta japonica]